MAEHKWITMGSGGLPMGAIPPLRCEVCKLVVQGAWRKKLSEHGCPGDYFIAGSLLDQAEWEHSHTVQLSPNASQGVTPERQALKDIVELIDNQYEDVYVLKMVDQIAKKALE